MIEKLLGVLPEHKDYLDSLQGKVLYVADWKDENNGGISFTDYDVERAAVRLLNPSMLSVFCDKFPENALPIKKGCFSQQCECILFPQDEAEDTDDWRLFIETKYAKDEAKARDERNNYPQKMVGQIEATVEYFRNKGILEENQVVYAIVSFPMLDNYNAWFDQNLIHEALAKHQIIVRATNQAKILNKKIILL
jgi:hypothetical protein|nr:hypothetical protein [Prevotella sp.]